MHCRGKSRHDGGNRHYPACCHYWLFPLVPSDLTGTIAGNRLYPTGAIEGPPLACSTACLLTSDCHFQIQPRNKKYRPISSWLGRFYPEILRPSTEIHINIRFSELSNSTKARKLRNVNNRNETNVLWCDYLFSDRYH